MTTVLLIAILTSAGLALVFLELFVPGGVFGTIGAIFLIAAIVQTYFAAGLLPAFGLLIGILVVIVTGLGLWAKWFPQTRLGRRIITNDTNRDDDAEDRYASLVGQLGKPATPCHPVGEAYFADKRYEVTTQGEYLKRGDSVRVLQAHGSRVVVEKAQG